MPVSFVGLVITASITVFILLIYRQLDRGNRSLDKVRRYSDMVRAKLTELVDEKTAEIKDIAIELQVNLKTGKEILKKVQSIEGNLSERINAISGVQAQVEEYEASLKNLADMSQRVDENLNRIHEESKFVDGVAQRLKTASTRLDGIEARIPAILEEAAKNAAARLEQVAARATSDTAARLAKIDEAVTRTDAQVKDFSAYLTRLEARKESMEKQLQKNLEQLSDQVTLASREAHNKLVVDLSSRIAALIASGEDKRAQLEASLASALEAGEGRVAALEKDLGGVLNRFEGDLATIEADYKKRLDSAADRGRALEHEAFAKLREDIESHARAAQAQLAAARKSVEEQLGGVHRDVESLYGKVRSDLKVWEAEASQAVKERAGILTQELDGVAQAVARRGEEIEERQGAMRRILDEVEAAEAEARRRLEEYKSAFVQKLDTAASEIEAAILERAEKRLADVEGDIAYRFDRLQQVNADVQELEGNLRTAMEKVGRRLNEDFESYIQVLESRRQDEKRKTEQVIAGIRAEMASLEQGLSELKARAYQDVSEKLKGFEDEFLADLKQRSVGMEQTLASWQQTVEKRMHTIAEAHSSERARIEEEYRDGLAERIEQVKALNQQRFSQIDEEMDNRIGALQLELEREQTRLEEQLAQARAALAGWQHEIEGGSREQKERVRAELLDIGRRVDELKKVLEEKTSSAIEAARREREGLENELRIRGQTLREDIADQLRLFRNAGADIKEKVDAAQQKLLARIEEEYAAAAQRMAAIERQQKEFVAQTRLFEQAERYRLDLEKGIDELKRELAALEPTRKELSQIDGDFKLTRRLVEEISGKLSRFLAEKRRIDSLDKDFNRLIGISKSIDVKLAAVTATGDSLDEIQVKLRSLESLEQEVESRYERLEKRQAILDATGAAVQKNFDALAEIETSLATVRQELKALPGSIEEIKGIVEALARDKERADAAVERLGRLDEVLRDIEERMDKLTKAREWLAKTETRLEAIGKQAQDHVKLLRTLVKSDSLKKEKGAPPLDTRQTVMRLANQGWSALEIARATGISLGEVELILELTPQNK